MKEYLSDLERYEFLTKEEELELWAKMKAGDKEAREKLIGAVLPYIVKLAKTYCKRRSYLSDLIQEGNFVVCRNIDDFDARKGRITTFMTQIVKFHLRERRSRLSRMINVPAYQYSKKRSKMSSESWFTQQIFKNDATSDDKLHQHVDENNPIDELIASEEKRFRERYLDFLILKLESREQDVIRRRLLKDTLDEIAQCHNLTRQRIKQIQDYSIEKLKGFHKRGKNKLKKQLC